MIGEKLAGRYEIKDELGRGGMGVVYRALDPLLNREVAVKLIAPSVLTPQTEQRFQAEAQVVAQMDHPSIVSIFDFGQHEGSLFFVMPVIEGTSLRQLIRDQELKLGEILDISLAVAEALEYSQARGIVHRDIKPENVMVTPEGSARRVRVMDFGLARASDVTRITKTGVMVGTMSYVSPEQVSGKAVDTRSDLYSLGTMMYECLAGEVPFSGEMQSVLYRVVHEFPQPLRERGADIDEELDHIVMACMAKDPEKRPQRAADLVQMVRAYRAHLEESDRDKSVMVTRTMQVQRPALAPFVGREDEFKELQSRLNAAVAGECQFVMVAGDMGVGKTRLLDELESLAQARQIRVLHGRFVEQDGAFPYHGFCEAIQEYFRQREAGSAGSELPDFSDLSGDLVSLFPMLSEIEAFRSSSSGSRQLGADDESRTPENRTEIFELLARTIVRLAEGQPLMLLFEELHGADVSVEALQYIVRRLGPTPTLLIGTYRDNEVQRGHPLSRMVNSFIGDRRFSSVSLQPFERRDHRSFLGTLIGGNEFADDLADRLFDSTEGNPFFTKELVRSMLDAGNIAQDDTGSWTLSGGTEIAFETLPATVHEAVEKRIGRLPEDMRRLLSVASVMGKTFDFRDLEKLARDEDDLDDLIDRLIQEGLIEEERQSRGDTLAFCSGVVREVLYAELSRRKRRSLHRRFAAHLEKRHAGKLERIYPQLVYHYAEGDEPEKTVEYGLAHARRSLEAFSPEEAVRSAKTALEFLDDEWEGEPTREAEARMLLAQAHQTSGDVDGALREIAAAIKIYESAGSTREAVGGLFDAARIAWKARRPGETRSWVERGLEAARAAGDMEKLAQLLSLAATLANLRGEYDRAAEFQKEAERLEHEAPTAEIEQEVVRGGSLSVALANPAVFREPAKMQTVEEWEILSNVYEPLLTTDDQGSLVPVLCARWEPREEGRAFVFHLADGIRFPDGTPLDAGAVKAAFERSIRESAGNPVPAFAAIDGAAAFAEGAAPTVAGLVVQGDDQLEIRLAEPLPIYPAMLTDARTGIFRAATTAGNGAGERSAGEDELLGTGPFALRSWQENDIRLVRNEEWRGGSPPLDEVVFRHGLGAAAIATGLESGDVDVGGDLAPADLERVLREARFRRGLVETLKSITYFVAFNTNSESAVRDERFRQALARSVRPQDMVWQTLGRFAQPANGLIPPGMFGHDPGKRRTYASSYEARKLLAASGVAGKVRLRAAVHPLIRDRYAALLEALFAVWGDLGVEVSVQTPDMASFMQTWTDNSDIDLSIMRWAADYNDPDNFTHSLFHSSIGLLRDYYCSDEADGIVTEARSEAQPHSRQRHYRQFESLLIDRGILVPLFHDVDYRVCSPRVHGLKLGTRYPAVNYADVWKAEDVAEEPETARAGGGTVQIPVAAVVETIDPSQGNRLEESEAIAGVYETLTRFAGARIEPLLAESFSTEEGGRLYRFRLRRDVRFHDGRRLTARDVRYSFERLLLNPKSERRGQFAPIVGARALLEKGRGELEGFHIHSTHEFTIELEKPLVFFPFLISDPAASIIPEGTGTIGNHLHEGAVGTGPFRVQRFDRGRTLELKRSPAYWRKGYPRCDALVFNFGVSPEAILSGFREGRFSLAADLHPEDVEALRRDPEFAAGYREAPSLSTYYLVFNIHRGATTDGRLRQRIVDSVDLSRLVRQTLGIRAVPAAGWIPPGLLEHEPTATRRSAAGAAEPVELTVAVHPVFRGEHAAFFDGLVSMLADAGVSLQPVTENMSEFLEASQSASVDVEIGRWYADFPDADAFADCLQSEEGALGQMCGCPPVDQLIAQGRAETDGQARQAIYRQLEGIVARDSLLLPLFHEQVYRFVHPRVDGLQVSDWQPIVSYSTLSVRDD